MDRAAMAVARCARRCMDAKVAAARGTHRPVVDDASTTPCTWCAVCRVGAGGVTQGSFVRHKRDEAESAGAVGRADDAADHDRRSGAVAAGHLRLRVARSRTLAPWLAHG